MSCTATSGGGPSTSASARSGAKAAAAAKAARQGRPRAKPARADRAAHPPGPKPAAEATGLEQEIEAAEAALRAIEDELADPAAWADARQNGRSTARHEEAKLTVEELYARWEAAASS